MAGDGTGGSTGKAKADGASQPARSRSNYLEAIDRLRAVLRQGITAFAAIAAVLVGTSPLTNLGKLDAGEPRWWAAMIAAGIALVAVIVVIAAAASVLAPRHFSLAQTDTSIDERVRTAGMLAGTDTRSVSELYGQWIEARRTHREGFAELSRTATTARDPELARATSEAERTVKQLDPIIVRVRDYGLWLKVSDAWKRARLVLLAGALVTGVSILAYAWAANPPDPAASPSAAVPARPSPVEVLVSGDAQDDFAALLGDGCATSFRAIALSRSGQTYDVVVTDEACDRLTRTSVTHGDDVRIEAVDTVVEGAPVEAATSRSQPRPPRSVSAEVAQPGYRSCWTAPPATSRRAIQEAWPSASTPSRARSRTGSRARCC